MRLGRTSDGGLEMQKPVGARRGPGAACHRAAFLRAIGVPELEPATSPFDPGYDPVTLEAHLAQSAHLMSTLKISMACWLIADESATRRKIAAARRHGVPTVTAAGRVDVAVAQRQLPAYLDLCADLGVTPAQCAMGFAAR